jgi:polysaccharide deacetylase family protein (PEP-CTERM system associated)
MRHSTRSLVPSDPAHLHRKQSVLDIPFDLVSYEDVLNLIERWRQTGIKQYVVLTPPHSVLLCRRDAALRAATCRAGLILPDGVGIILAARILNYPHRGRVTGPALMLKLCDWGRPHRYRHYFYGGAEGVADALAHRLSQQFPGLHVSGTCCPPFRSLSPEEDQAIVERINAAEPDVVWVGLGSPKQEKWMHEHLGRIRATVLVGVGAAFDFHSGRKRWAPAPIRAVGLEWVYRFVLEPRRMCPRCITAPQFLFGVARQRWDRRRSLRPTSAFPSRAARDAPPPRRGRRSSMSLQNAFSVDVEEWFHILRSAAAPRREDWSALESRSDANVNRLLDLLHEHKVRATFFWLGWMAEKHNLLLRRCSEAGHEIASHGYHHVLPREVGPAGFKEDIERARKVLEDLVGRPIHGFRTPGFGVHGETEWAFEVIKEAGYEYDSSVFPPYHNHRCFHHWQAQPYWIPTRAGRLVEIPLSTVDFLGHKLFLFGGGYLRLAPQRLIQWGVRQLHRAGVPLIVYIHPREVDPQQPRLPLSALRRFRCYVNLDSTVPKLAWLCRSCAFVPMMEMARELLDPCPAVEKARLLAADSRYDPQSQTA